MSKPIFRCGWCKVQLRWWQGRFCRRCHKALRTALMPMPFQPNSRRFARPDRWPR